MEIRVRIQWTETARNLLAPMPSKVRRGLIAKIGELADSDPSQVGKPLIGPLLGYRRITYSRYRAIFGVKEESIGDGEVIRLVTVQVVAVGIRKDRDRKDIYKVAKKLVEMGLIHPPDEGKDDEK